MTETFCPFQKNLLRFFRFYSRERYEEGRVVDESFALATSLVPCNSDVPTIVCVLGHFQINRKRVREELACNRVRPLESENKREGSSESLNARAVSSGSGIQT